MALLDSGQCLDLKKMAVGRWAAEVDGGVKWADLTLMDHGHNRTTLHVEVKP